MVCFILLASTQQDCKTAEVVHPIIMEQMYTFVPVAGILPQQFHNTSSQITQKSQEEQSREEQIMDT